MVQRDACRVSDASASAARVAACSDVGAAPAARGKRVRRRCRRGRRALRLRRRGGEPARCSATIRSTGATCRAGRIDRPRRPTTGARCSIDLHGAHAAAAAGRGAGIARARGGPGGARIVSSGGTGALERLSTTASSARGPRQRWRWSRTCRDRGAPRRPARHRPTTSSVRRVRDRAARRGTASRSAAAASRSATTRAADCGRLRLLRHGRLGHHRREPAAATSPNAAAMAGFNVMGIGHALADCAAQGGGKDRACICRPPQLDVRGCRRATTPATASPGWATRWHLADNQALDNGGDGVAVRGPGLHRRRRQSRQRQPRRRPRAARRAVRHRRRRPARCDGRRRDDRPGRALLRALPRRRAAAERGADRAVAGAGRRAGRRWTAHHLAKRRCTAPAQALRSPTSPRRSTW